MIQTFYHVLARMPAWYFIGAYTSRNKVQELQNRAARVLTYSNYDVDAGHLFKLLGWKNLACQHNSKSYDGLQVSGRVGSRLPQF